MEKKKQSGGARVEGRSVLEKYFSVFMRCSRSVFLDVYGVLAGKGRGFLLVRSLRCLRRLLFTCLRPKSFSSRFNAFRSALFGLAVFYANWLDFQLFRNFFRCVLLIVEFHSGTGCQCARRAAYEVSACNHGCYVTH